MKKLFILTFALSCVFTAFSNVTVVRDTGPDKTVPKISQVDPASVDNLFEPAVMSYSYELENLPVVVLCNADGEKTMANTPKIENTDPSVILSAHAVDRYWCSISNIQYLKSKISDKTTTNHTIDRYISVWKDHIVRQC